MSFHFVVEQVEVGEKTKGKEEYLSQSACVSWSLLIREGMRVASLGEFQALEFSWPFARFSFINKAQ